MEILEIKVSRKTRMIDLPKDFTSIDGENLQSKFVFSFTDEFVEGQARLEYEKNDEKNYVILNREGNTYTTFLTSIFTKEGLINMQLVITEGTNMEDVPVFKSNKFYLYCNAAINAVNEVQPEGVDLWIDQANAKLNEVENVNITMDGTTLTVTSKDGSVVSENVKGDKGEKGDKGDQGIQGEKGDKGDTGATGPQGPQGPQGIQGIQGEKGEQGIQGEAGHTGSSGVYTGPSEPTDADVTVWIDTSDDTVAGIAEDGAF